MRERSARVEWRASYITHDIMAGLVTKLLASGEKKKGCMCYLLHHIFGFDAKQVAVEVGMLT